MKSVILTTKKFNLDSRKRIVDVHKVVKSINRIVKAPVLENAFII